MTKLRSGSATDVGKVRNVNEDRLYVADSLFAVADGLGGHQAGEVASKTAVETLGSSFIEKTLDGLVDAVLQANHAVWQLAQDNPDLQGMATTLTAVALVNEDDDDQLALVNVGDSRAYRLQQGELEQLTEDHSLVEQLVREGRLTSEEAAVHPQRSIITRALGLDPDVEVDTWYITPYDGDRLLLCSDGLTNEVSDEDIASTLRRVSDPDKVAKDLVEQARDHGGNDNITVVVVDVVDDGGRSQAASEELARSETDGRNATTITRKPVAEPPSDDRGDDGARTTKPASARGGAVQTGVMQKAPPKARPAGARPTPAPSRGVTWRVIAFAAALVLILIVAGGAISWYARGTYTVAAQREQVVILKGRDMLWFDPSVEQEPPLRLSDLLPVHRRALRSGHEVSSLADAQRYVNRIRDEANERRFQDAANQPVPPPPTPPTTTPGGPNTPQ